MLQCLTLPCTPFFPQHSHCPYLQEGFQVLRPHLPIGSGGQAAHQVRLCRRLRLQLLHPLVRQAPDGHGQQVVVAALAGRTVTLCLALLRLALLCLLALCAALGL